MSLVNGKYPPTVCIITLTCIINEQIKKDRADTNLKRKLKKGQN